MPTPGSDASQLGKTSTQQSFLGQCSRRRFAVCLLYRTTGDFPLYERPVADTACLVLLLIYFFKEVPIPTSFSLILYIIIFQLPAGFKLGPSEQKASLLTTRPPPHPSYLVYRVRERKWHYVLKCNFSIIIISFCLLFGIIRKSCLSTFRIILSLCDSIRITRVMS